jgi:hypothetical protein
MSLRIVNAVLRRRQMKAGYQAGDCIFVTGVERWTRHRGDQSAEAGT